MGALGRRFVASKVGDGFIVVWIFGIVLPKMYRAWHWRAASALAINFPEALLFVERLKHDHDNAPAQMRQPLKYTGALKLHQACGAFLHYLREYEMMVSASDALKARDELYRMFVRGFMDPDLHHSLEHAVPPGRIEDVSSFRLAFINHLRIAALHMFEI